MPILPPTWVTIPACFSTQPIRAVVVDLPLVPVMATTRGRWPSGRASSARANSSMSPITSTPAARALSTVQCGLGWVSGAPGDSTRAANPDQSATVRSSTANPSASACIRLETLSSHRTGTPPPAFSARAAVSPDRPRPKTAMRRRSKPGTKIMRARSSTAASAWRDRPAPAWPKRSRSGSPPSIPASPSSRNGGGSGPSGRCASWWPCSSRPGS